MQRRRQESIASGSRAIADQLIAYHKDFDGVRKMVRRSPFPTHLAHMCACSSRPMVTGT